MRFIWMLFALAFVGLMLAGCTQNNASTGGNNSASTASAGTPGMPSALGNSGTVTPPLDPKAEVTRLLHTMNSTAWMAEYTVDMGASSTVPVTGMAMYRNGQGTYRYDVSVSTMDVRMYHLQSDAAGAGVVCAKNSTMDWACVKSPSLSTDLFSTLGENLTNETVVALPSKTVAGVVTSCYNVTNQGLDSGWGEACFSPTDGAVLFLQAAGKQSDGSMSIASFTATTYSNSVSDSDFTPPSTPISQSANGGGQ